MTKKLKGYGTFDVVLIVILVIVSFACVYPFWYVFANSFASYNVASRGAVAWWPSELSLDGYHAVFENKYLVSGFTVTVLRTIVATSAHVLFTSFVSYDVTVPMGRGFSHADGWAMHPPFLFCRAKRETGRARSKEKGAWMRSGAVALRAEGGRRIGACSDLALPSGTLGPSAIPSTAVPWRMVRKLPGCKDAFELLLFSCLALRRSGDFRH